VFNLIVAPQGVAFLNDLLVRHGYSEAEGLRMAMLVLAPTGFWAAYHLYLATKTIAADQQRAVGYTP
jgi:hypothetical protein